LRNERRHIGRGQSAAARLLHLHLRLPASLLQHGHVVLGRQVGNEQSGGREIERAVLEDLEHDRIAAGGRATVMRL
jgi:hypothetical protein